MQNQYHLDTIPGSGRPQCMFLVKQVVPLSLLTPQYMLSSVSASASGGTIDFVGRASA